ncbi:hypothetical protein Btru_076881 [Bulinus truncatus]|nr:hypothetical protein Btru_076881 [Bulinus truncatus]
MSNDTPVPKPWKLCDVNHASDSDILPEDKEISREDCLAQRSTAAERSKSKCERSSPGQTMETSACNILLTLCTFLEAKENEQQIKKGKTSEREQTDSHEGEAVDVFTTLAEYTRWNKGTETSANSALSDRETTVISEYRPSVIDKPRPSPKLPPISPSGIPHERVHGKPALKQQQQQARHNQTRLPTLKTKSPRPLTLKPPLKIKAVREKKQHSPKHNLKQLNVKQHNLILAKSKQLDLANKFSVKNWKRGVLKNMKRDLDKKIKNKNKPQNDRGKVETMNESVPRKDSVHSIGHLADDQARDLSPGCKDFKEGNQGSSEVRVSAPEVSEYFTVPEFDCSYRYPDVDVPASAVSEGNFPLPSPIVLTTLRQGVDNDPQSSPEAHKISPISLDVRNTAGETPEAETIILPTGSGENGPPPAFVAEQLIKLENTLDHRETNSLVCGVGRDVGTLHFELELGHLPDSVDILQVCPDSAAGVQTSAQTTFQQGENVLKSTRMKENTIVFTNILENVFASEDIEDDFLVPPIRKRHGPEFHCQTPSLDFERVDSNVSPLIQKDVEDRSIDLKIKPSVSCVISPRSPDCVGEDTVQRLAAELLRLKKHFSPPKIDPSSFTPGTMLEGLICPRGSAETRQFPPDSTKQSSAEINNKESPERAGLIEVAGGKKTRKSTTVIWSSAEMNDLVRRGDNKSPAHGNTLTPSPRCSPLTISKGNSLDCIDILHAPNQSSPVKTTACQCLPEQVLNLGSLAVEVEAFKTSVENKSTMPATKLRTYLQGSKSLVVEHSDSNKENEVEVRKFRRIVHVNSANVFHQTSSSNQSEIKMSSAISIEEMKTEPTQKEQSSISPTLPRELAGSTDAAKNRTKALKSSGIITKKFSIPVKCPLSRGKNLPSNEIERQFKVHTVKMNGVKGTYVKSNSQNKIVDTEAKVISEDQTKRFDDICQLKSDSYTTKHKSLENNVKNNWEGTPAFQRKLQFLLKNNKYVFNKNVQARNVASVINSSTELILNKKNSKVTLKLDDPLPIIKSGTYDKMLSKMSKRKLDFSKVSQSKPGKSAQSSGKESAQLESALTKALFASDVQSTTKRLLSRKKALKYKPTKSLYTDPLSPSEPVLEEEVIACSKVHFETPEIPDKLPKFSSDHLLMETLRHHSLSLSRQNAVPVKPYDRRILHPAQFEVLPDVYSSLVTNSEPAADDATVDRHKQGDDKTKSSYKSDKKPNRQKRSFHDKLRLNRKCQALRGVTDKIDNQTYEHNEYPFLPQTKTGLDSKGDEREINFDYLDLGNQQPVGSSSSHSEESLLQTITTSRRYSKLLKAFTGSLKSDSFKTLSSLYKKNFNELRKSDLVENPFETRLTNLSYLLQSYNDANKAHCMASPTDQARFATKDTVSAGTDTSHLAQISHLRLSASESSCEEVSKFSFPLISSAQDLNPVKLIKADLVMGPSVRTSDDDSEGLLQSVGQRRARPRCLTSGDVSKDATLRFDNADLQNLRMSNIDPIITDAKIQNLLHRRKEMKVDHVMITDLQEQLPTVEENNVLDMLLSRFTRPRHNNENTLTLDEINHWSKSPKIGNENPVQVKDIILDLQNDEIISMNRGKLEVNMEHTPWKCKENSIPRIEQLLVASPQVSPRLRETSGGVRTDESGGSPTRWEMKLKDLGHVCTAGRAQHSPGSKCDADERNRYASTPMTLQALGDILIRKSSEIYSCDGFRLRNCFKTSEKSPESLKIKDVTSTINTLRLLYPSNHIANVKSDATNQDMIFSDQRKIDLHRSLSYFDKMAMKKTDDVTLKSSESCTMTHKPDVRLSLIMCRSSGESHTLVFDGQHSLRKRSIKDTSPVISNKRRRLSRPHFQWRVKNKHPLKMTIRMFTTRHQECHFKSTFRQRQLMPHTTSSVSGTTSISLAEIYKVSRSARKQWPKVYRSHQAESSQCLRTCASKQAVCDGQSEQADCGNMLSLDKSEQVKLEHFTSADKSEQAECDNLVGVDKSEQTECDKFVTADKSEQVEGVRFLTLDKSEKAECHRCLRVDKSAQAVCDTRLRIDKSIQGDYADHSDIDKCTLCESVNCARIVETLCKGNECTDKEDNECRGSLFDVNDSLLDLAVNKTQDLESLLNLELNSKDESHESSLNKDTKLLFSKASRSAHKVSRHRRRSSMRLTALPKHFPFTRENKCVSPDVCKADPHLSPPPQPKEKKHQKLSDFLQDARNCCVVPDTLSHVTRSKASSVTNTVHSSEEDEERLLAVLGRPVKRQYSRSKMKHLDTVASDCELKSKTSLDDEIETGDLKEGNGTARTQPDQYRVENDSPQFELKLTTDDEEVGECKARGGQYVHYVWPQGVVSPNYTVDQPGVSHTRSYSDPNLMEGRSASQRGEGGTDLTPRDVTEHHFGLATFPRPEPVESQPDSVSYRSRDTHVHISEMYLTQSTIDRIHAEDDISFVVENLITAETGRNNPSSSSSSIVLSWIGSDISEADNLLAGNTAVETAKHEQPTRSGFHFTAASFIGCVGGISRGRIHGDVNNDNALLIRNDPIQSFNSLYDKCERIRDWSEPGACGSNNKVSQSKSEGSNSMPTEPLDGNNEYPLTRCHKQDRSCSNHDLLMDPAAMLDDSYGCSALYFPFASESEKNCGPVYSAESNGLTPCEPNRHVITNSERDCCMKNPPEKSAQPNNKAAQSEKHRFSKKRNKSKVKEEQLNITKYQPRTATPSSVKKACPEKETKPVCGRKQKIHLQSIKPSHSATLNDTSKTHIPSHVEINTFKSINLTASQQTPCRNGDDSGSEDISTKINRPQNSATFSPPANNNLSWSAMHEHDIANDGPSGQVTIDPVHVTSPTVQLATDSGADNHSNGPPEVQGIGQPNDSQHEASTQENISATTPQKVKNIIQIKKNFLKIDYFIGHVCLAITVSTKIQLTHPF